MRVKPIIHTQSGTFRVEGTASGSPTCFEDADAPEVAARMVWEDVRTNVPLYVQTLVSTTGTPAAPKDVQWRVFNPAHVFDVSCKSFD